MPKFALVSPVALALGLALTGAAAAQNMIGTQDVTDADWSAVQEHCDQLVADEVTAGMEETDADDNDSGHPVITGNVDFDAITLEDCRAAGLVS
ncbi:hypothetical protein [Pelagibacterium limicola]|uniref:hypothetical protein n=1 Tax=Pelagibacterium limicola TaxID=2791022 RepID=UPI0018AFF99B|nr:hypothetical protein [Pelagibacterium limicola]